jgi:alanine racemase
MYLLLSDIISIVSGEASQSVEGLGITDITYDSRSIIKSKESLFIALTTGKRDGHQYISDAIAAGCQYFLVNKTESLPQQSGVIYIKVQDTLAAYQAIAAWRRSLVDIPIIGITGSNGKTIVKEWLASTLDQHFAIIKTPKSYNSQIGLPQSLLPIGRQYTLGVFETGISQVGEMETLANILKPTIGIFTNIGDAHSESFESLEQKLEEKLLLFSSVETLIYSSDNPIVREAIAKSVGKKVQKFSWGSLEEDTLQILNEITDVNGLSIKFNYDKKTYDLTVPLLTRIERENLLHVLTTAMHLEVPFADIELSFQSLNQLPMRLQVYQGNRGNVIINDSYTSDLQAFRYALEYQKGHYPDMHTCVITSEGVKSDQLTQLFDEYQIKHVVYLNSTIPPSEAVKQIESLDLSDTTFLIKGHRIDKLELVSDALASKSRSTTLQVHLPSLKHNLAVYSQMLKPETKMILVVKASAYGSGSIHVSRYLSQLPIDYLAVAVLDEAIELREQGIGLPILLFNFSDYNAVLSLWKYDIEPEVYSIEQLKLLSRTSKHQTSVLNIHLKIETGLNRLGLTHEELEQVGQLISDSPNLKVSGIFSHLSGSDDSKYDDFTKQQYETYVKLYEELSSRLGYRPIRHLINTAGIVRHPQYQLDAVRLGLGLYGIDETTEVQSQLNPVLSLTSQVLQIKQVKAGESVSYGRSFIANADKRIAILGIGYADGLPRSGYHHGSSVYFKGQRLPFVGNICMDVCMIDVSDVEISPGDSVEIFGHNLSIQEVAQIHHTISYEIISQISPRVKRIYIED